MRNGFGQLPSVKFSRSQLPLSHGTKTTCSVGSLIPVDVQEILPGDTFTCKTTLVERVVSSFLKPVIDNLYMDVFHFFVPDRIIYDKFERVFGNPTPSAYEDNALEELPLNYGNDIVYSGSLADYFGYPVGTKLGAGEINIMDFRAYALICDKWFRNENIIDEIFVQKGDTVSTEQFNNNDFGPNNYTGKPFKVSRKKDYFSACLPNTQKGAPVTFALTSGFAPVVTNSNDGYIPLKVGVPNSTSIGFEEGNIYQRSNDGINSQLYVPYFEGTVDGNPLTGIKMYEPVDNYSYLKTDLSNVTLFNVNDFRLAVQTQRMLERDSLFGSRYNEFNLGHFGVASDDARWQIPEYLGGGRIPLFIKQVEQTSQSTSDSPLGNVGGYSWSNGKGFYSKSFAEHGRVLTLICIRQEHTYQQGIPKRCLRKVRNDFYDPLFATLGEQPVYTSELYVRADGELVTDLKGDVFGYNEAWADYRYRPSMITGQMRSGIINSLDIWHFGDYYANQPVLSATFLNENAKFVDRTLSVPSNSQDQFLLDLWFDVKAVRVMPLYSTPGLVDHH